MAQDAPKRRFLSLIFLVLFKSVVLFLESYLFVFILTYIKPIQTVFCGSRDSTEEIQVGGSKMAAVINT